MRTAHLWLQYMNMIDILRNFIKAERTGNWRLYLQCVQDMLPYFAASVHRQYAKSAYVCLKMIITLPEMVVGQNVDRLNVDRQNVDRHNAEQTKCRTDKMSNRQNVDRQNAEQTKCRTDKMSNTQNVDRQNSEQTKCRQFFFFPILFFLKFFYAEKQCGRQFWNSVECGPVETRVLNPTASEAS